MSRYIIRTINCVFEVEVYEFDAENAEAALAEGIDGGIMIIAEETRLDAVVCSVEVVVDDVEGTELMRSAVTLSVGRLLPRSRTSLACDPID